MAVPYEEDEVNGRLRIAKATYLERIYCWEDTKKVAASMPRPPKSHKLTLDPNLEMDKGFSMTRLIVDDEDSLDCGLKYVHANDPVVLNLADDCWAGGCVDLGSAAQEESIFRRTNLCMTLDQRLYPLKDDEGIYSPNVTIFKQSEGYRWAPMVPFQRIALMTVPGVKYPRFRDDRLCSADVERLKTKIKTMLHIAYVFEHDTVILGASGCGAWKCPRVHVAEIFREVLEDYMGVFENVVFAIKRATGDHQNERDNFEVFTEVFQK